jgi:hypothetical protein
MVLQLQPLCFGLQIAPAEPMSNSQCEERDFSSPMGYNMAGLCRFPLQARSSMEACGIDVYTIVRQIGWEIEAVQTPEAPFRLSGLACMK